MADNKEVREFLHDLMNSLTILEGYISLTNKNVKNKDEEQTEFFCTKSHTKVWDLIKDIKKYQAHVRSLDGEE